MTKAVVQIELKPGVLDPEGKVVEQSLLALGFDDVVGVRRAKVFEIALNDLDPSSARAQVERMCRLLLANPVIENYTIEIAA